MLSTLQQLWIYNCNFIVCVAEDKRREEETRRVYVHIWAKSSHYSRLAAHHSHPSSLKQLSSSSLGSVCISQMMTCCLLCLPQKHLLRCKSQKHFTIASIYWSFFFFVLLVLNLGKFMIDVLRRNLIRPRNHKLIKTYKLSWRGPPENHPTTYI